MKKVISKDGTSIAYDQLGNGQPIILVDGALCSRSFGPMPKLAPLLSQHFTVYTYDRRGRGDSGDTAPYEVDHEVDDLEALITEAGGSVSVYGISSGAALALEAAARGLNIKKLALYEPPFMVKHGGHRPPVDHQVQLKQMISSGRRAEAVKFFMTKMVGVPALFVVMMQLMPRAWSELKDLAHTLPYDAAIMGDFSLPKERVSSVTVPTLVIGGEKSDVRLREAVQVLAATLPNAESRTLIGQTHNVSSAVIAPVLKEFFKY
jgi:pimeloyl-ACP methyl ester carboxylesterase